MTFLSKHFVKKAATDAAESGKGPAAILENPIIRNMLKSYRKEIFEFLTGGEQDLIRIIESIELLPGEKQIAPVLDIDEKIDGSKEIRLLIAAYTEDLQLGRVVHDIPLREFLTDWLNSKLK